MGKSKQPTRTLTVPGLRTSGRGDPAKFDERVAISMTHDEFVQLGGTSMESKLVAGAIQQDSLKQRLLRVICEQGPFDDSMEVMKAARSGPKDTSFGIHEVVHLLYSLNKQGLIKFKANRGASKTDSLTHLEATERGYQQCAIPVPGKQQHNAHGGRTPGTSRAGHAVGKDPTEARNHGTRAEGGPIERRRAPVAPATTPEAKAAIERIQAAPEEPKPKATWSARSVREAAKPAPTPRIVEEPKPTRAWPELEAIRAKAAEVREARARAAKYVDAAAVLEEVDPAEAERLMGLAAGIDRDARLTPLEAEYLAFANTK